MKRHHRDTAGCPPSRPAAGITTVAKVVERVDGRWRRPPGVSTRGIWDLGWSVATGNEWVEVSQSRRDSSVLVLRQQRLEAGVVAEWVEQRVDAEQSPGEDGRDVHERIQHLNRLVVLTHQDVRLSQVQ